MRPTLEFAQAHVQRSQRFGKFDLLSLAQILMTKHQHSVLVHRLFDCFDLSRRERITQIDSSGFGCEWLQRIEVKHAHDLPHQSSLMPADLTIAAHLSMS